MRSFCATLYLSGTDKSALTTFKQRDMQLPHWFGSFLVCCKMSRAGVCQFYRQRITFQYAVLTVGQYRGAHIPGALSPAPLNFVWRCVVFCGP